ncbi:LUD domain-containing protein [Nibrella saemangeumensis]|uniref:LUD domain-containing protein n=2 Tax=Nibrella saemangeumensis TaxID=1084526 RepID=A0ABP8MSG5_9BACT
MNSREKVLAAVLQNQPALSPLPDMSIFRGEPADLAARYCDMGTYIGSKVYRAGSLAEVASLIQANFDTDKRIITTLPDLSDSFELLSDTADPRTFNDVNLAIIKAKLAVAENGAVWLTEQQMGQRIIPYICQHLAVVVLESSIVPTLHEAYAQIGAGDYGFGAFIGGPSKTADIEQALVLGAHGPISMSLFVVND